jgi:U3 small nucleolar RNA-associated protein 11
VANKYTPEELMLMKTQDMGYILQKLQSEKKVDEYLKTKTCQLFYQIFPKGVDYDIVQYRKLKS